MKSRRNRSQYSNPFLLWTELAFKTGEMMLASAQVIGHRTARMAAAAPAPSERDRREFALMGQEKIDAASESARAMAGQAMKTNLHLGAQAAGDMLATASAAMSLATSRTPRQAAASYAKLLRTVTQSAGTAAQLSNSTARIAKGGLEPVHARARANARRLARR